MNTSVPLQCFFTLLETPLEAIPLVLFHGHGSTATTPSCVQDHSVMFLLHASTSLSFIFLLIHLFSLLLIKLFTFLSLSASSPKGHNDEKKKKKNELFPVTSELANEEKEDLVADIIHGGEELLFWNQKSSNIDMLRVEEGRDSQDQNIFQVKETSTRTLTSVYSSPLEDFLVTNTTIPSPVISSPDNAAVDDEDTNKVNFCDLTEEKKEFVEEKSCIILDPDCHSDRKKFKVDELHEDHREEHCGESLTTESTSKSSIEWRSSAIFRDSETEYSSSRRSSSRWESYAVFRKYDEEMLFFDRISAQKLTETESLRSIKVEPRSISQRIVHKLTTKHKHPARERSDPYQELESAYVAQICLTWEALNWNYSYFRRANSDPNIEVSGCPASVAQQFQQFQVLLQRFIENEPYERGRRPEVYARVRVSSPRFLQVPEFRDSEGDDIKEDLNSRISSEEFLSILEDAIRTFMNFLKTDKESHCQLLRSLIKKKLPSSFDQNYLNSIKKVNHKKKLRLKDLGRRGKCLRKRKLKQEEEMGILMGLIDMKVVSRVLRMAEISEEQLHWCEEKMTKVRIWEGKMKRDSSPLFFPVH